MMENGNGNGNGGKSLWTAAGVCSGVLLTIMGVVERGYARDKEEMHARQDRMEAQQLAGVQKVAELVERVEHVRSLAQANKARIEAAFFELDTKLQRELNLADDTLRAELVNLDARLQAEIGNNAARLTEMDGWMRAASEARWTRAEQAAFEAQAGFKLERKL